MIIFEALWTQMRKSKYYFKHATALSKLINSSDFHPSPQNRGFNLLRVKNLASNYFMSNQCALPFFVSPHFCHKMSSDRTAPWWPATWELDCFTLRKEKFKAHSVQPCTLTDVCWQVREVPERRWSYYHMFYFQSTYYYDRHDSLLLINKDWLQLKKCLSICKCIANA